jgi:hypothetical protein
MSNAIGSHHSSAMKSDVWLTPPSIIQALGRFDLDPCTPEIMPWVTAEKRFTKADDGLIQDWTGRVWLNPPVVVVKINRKYSIKHLTRI